MSDAEAYVYSGGDFGAFSREYGFESCGEALEAFKGCESAFKWLTIHVGIAPDELNEIREELENL